MADWLIREQEKGNPVGLHCGSLCGRIRDYLGITGFSYMMIDDVELLKEIFHTVGELCLQAVKRSLDLGITFDYAHFWEDICYKNGSLLSPGMFEEYTASYYKKITDLLLAHGIDIVSVDCDGMVDQLLPVWLENGVNTMFPIRLSGYIPCPDHRIPEDARWETVQYYCEQIKKILE